MFQAIAKFFSNLFSKIQGNKALQEFENFAGQVFTAEKVLLLASLKAFAIQAVTTAETTGLDSVSKRSQAFTQISTQAQMAGIVTGASMIGLVLEMALQTLRNGNQGNVNG